MGPETAGRASRQPLGPHHGLLSGTKLVRAFSTELSLSHFPSLVTSVSPLPFSPQLQKRAAGKGRSEALDSPVAVSSGIVAASPLVWGPSM